jgi:hypothetical protein
MPTTFAQNTSTQGKEFWLSFMHNGFKEHDLGGWVTTQVLISAKRTCSGTVTNPLTGWEQTFLVGANSVITVEIPEAQGYHDGSNYEITSRKAIKVTASDTISVYCTNIAHVSFDASFVLPVESLGDEYIIQCHDQSTDPSSYGNSYVDNNQTSAFLIVATEDNTEIDITPTCATLSGHPAGQTFSINLNAGETYQVRSTRSGIQRDLSGTHVIAADCKRIAVFNGNTVTCIPVNIGNGYDHVFEQAMPLRSWGKSFVVTGSLDRNRDFVKITSSADNNEIKKNGQELVTLNYGQSYIFPIDQNEVSCFLQADFPSAVYLFNNSSRDRLLGDPSMVWIAPVEQRINEITFTTFNNSSINITNHNVNIIVNTSDIANVYFDNELISPLIFHRVNGNDNYSFARMSISHNVHHISCANGFNAHVYGFGDAKGYAYLVGSNAIDLSTSLTLNDVQVLANDNFPYCVDQPVTFSAEVNSPEYTLLWSFGDGTTSTENPTTHTYHDRRVYEAFLYVETTAAGCLSGNSDTLTFYVDATQQYVIESGETCSGELYSGHGFDNVMIYNDTILSRLVDNPNNPECKDSLLVYVTANPKCYVPITDSRCWQGTPSVYDDYGFSFEYDGPGTYEHTLELQTVQGCDSIVTLTLTVAGQVTYDFDHHECSGSYTWDGRIYDHAGDYSWTYTTSGGCDSIATLHLSMGMDQHFEFDTLLCGSFIWDGIEYTTSGDYTRHYDTYDGCDSVVVCHLDVSGNIEGATMQVNDCDSYEWLGNTYYESGIYSHAYATPLGCDSTVYLDLSLDYSPYPDEIYPTDTSNLSPHWVITATEFLINSYEFSLYDTVSPKPWDSIRWEFEDPSVQWLLERDTTPFLGKKCKMYVLNYVPDTVWLIATPYNGCDTIGKRPQRYWFVCSFYGIDENNPSTSQGDFDFDITPNPNNGEMSILFGDMQGRVEASVYDMQGQMVDRFSLMATPQSRHLYQLIGKKSGIYLFVFNYKGSIITRKIILTH